jgi:hypothetical protein
MSTSANDGGGAADTSAKNHRHLYSHMRTSNSHKSAQWNWTSSLHANWHRGKPEIGLTAHKAPYGPKETIPGAKTRCSPKHDRFMCCLGPCKSITGWKCWAQARVGRTSLQSTHVQDCKSQAEPQKEKVGWQAGSSQIHQHYSNSGNSDDYYAAATETRLWTAAQHATAWHSSAARSMLTPG